MRVAFGVLCAGVLAGLTGCGTPSLLITPVAGTSDLNEVVVQDGKGLFGGKVAIIEVEGTLANVKTGGLLSPSENVLSQFVQELNKAADDSDVKAVVLRVNSPGGTVSASDAMYQILMRFKAKTHKPVVASAMELDASGAYYVTCAADKIVAQPTSLVGSIGVIFETVNLQGTMQKIGVSTRAYKSAVHKDIGSPFRESTPEEDAIFQGLIDDYYARFKNIVLTNRHLLDDDTFKTLTDGRVFSGERACEVGLVDQVGLLEDAIDLAKKMAKSPNAETIEYKHPYGYGGSIYAIEQTPQPTAQSNVLHLDLPESATFMPSGFYFLWKP